MPQIQFSKPPFETGKPCPCGSTSNFEQCCLVGDQIMVKMPRLLPPGPATRFAHPKCFLNPTNDCSTDITGEHYFSKNMLKSMPGDIEYFGMPWTEPGKPVSMGINSAVSNILCGRHNSSLHFLDDTAGRLFRFILETGPDLENETHTNCRSLLINGKALELWCLKALYGAFHAKLASNNQTPLLETHTLDVQPFIDALDGRPLQHPHGLYLLARQAQVIETSSARISLVPTGPADGNVVQGVRIGLWHFEFEVVLDAGAADISHLRERAQYRPMAMVFRNNVREHTVGLTWEASETSGAIVEFVTFPKGGTS